MGAKGSKTKLNSKDIKMFKSKVFCFINPLNTCKKVKNTVINPNMA